MHLNGLGVDRDTNKAVHFLRKHAIYSEVDEEMIKRLEPELEKYYRVTFQGKLTQTLQWSKEIQKNMPVDEAFALGEKYLKGKGAIKDADIAYKIWSWIAKKHPEAGYRVAFGIEKKAFGITSQRERNMSNAFLFDAAEAGHYKAIMEHYRRHLARRNPAAPQDYGFHYYNAVGCLLLAKRKGHEVEKELEELKLMANMPELLGAAYLMAKTSNYRSCAPL
ncbi:MAG: hypothetical protein O2912_02225 [Proteobacteria bacterium]|nr:hypothetical protein [Pseudomonadota bacterium]